MHRAAASSADQDENTTISNGTLHAQEREDLALRVERDEAVSAKIAALRQQTRRTEAGVRGIIAVLLALGAARPAADRQPMTISLEPAVLAWAMRVSRSPTGSTACIAMRPRFGGHATRLIDVRCCAFVPC